MIGGEGEGEGERDESDRVGKTSQNPTLYSPAEKCMKKVWARRVADQVG